MSRAIVFINGELIGREEFYQDYITAKDTIACADGGAEYAFELGITPDLIVGDFDSVSSTVLNQYREQGVKIKKFPVQKDKTDTQLLLENLIEMGFEEIIVFAALGKRLDHSLANIYLLEQLTTSGVQIKFVTEQDTIELITDNRIIKDKAGNTISFLPITSQVEGVELKGVKYPLTDATLTRGSTLSISNIIEDEEAEINLKNGKLLMIINY
ncbi:thiamine diphosphokinase [Halanaerocella petrolearia]